MEGGGPWAVSPFRQARNLRKQSSPYAIIAANPKNCKPHPHLIQGPASVEGKVNLGPSLAPVRED